MFESGYVRKRKKRTKGRGGGNVQNSWFADVVMLIA